MAEPAGRPAPVSTYRVQLCAPTADSPGFTFSDAARIVPYLAALGVTHLYCSPYLAAAPGSQHGYDVVDHTKFNPELGGEAGHARLVRACRTAGLGIIQDIVPNHMSVVPEWRNAAWWSLLLDGRDSPYATWFDVEWDNTDNPGKVLLPILGDSLAACVEAGEVRLSDDGERVLYYDHKAPIAPGTLVPGGKPEDVLDTLDAQHYRLCQWRVADEELNYRRFFDVTTLAAIRVEDPDVFDATHALVLEQIADGTLDGLRIDHPDGLADPDGYLRRLAEATGGAWTVVEKILEPGEPLPPTWPVAGTVGYDALNRLVRLFVDPAAAGPLTDLYTELTGDPTPFAEVVAVSKAYVLDRILRPEVDRLTALALAESRVRRLDLTRQGLREALRAVLGCFDVYRAYIGPGRTPTLEARGTVVRACSRAAAVLPERGAEIDLVEELALGGPAEFVVRFQQTCGPVMAKGIEDTAFYRYTRFVALNEVGGDPGHLPTEPTEAVDDFHAAAALAQDSYPLTMTTLTTHDTKRSEDVRARLAVLSEDPRGWADAARTLLQLGARHSDLEHGWPDRPTLYLLLQTLVGAWPLSVDRAVEYLGKATREAKLHTTWTEANPGYDAALRSYIAAVLEDRDFVNELTRYVYRIGEFGRTNGLAQKLLQLTQPGVADTYQGAELWDTSLVDPDNRRPVDFAERRTLLAELDDSGTVPAVDESGAAKLLVVSRTLRLRRAHPEWFGAAATYEPLAVAGSAAEHVVAFARSRSAVTVVPRLNLSLRQGGGWRDTTLTLPEGRWTDQFTGRRHDGGTAYLLRLLRDFPVALLARTE